MENFFYNENFCSDIESLMSDLDLDEDEIQDLEDDWHVTCEETTLEKIFVIKKDFAVNAIMNQTETWEDRFPEECDDLFKRIESAIEQSIDIEKMNNLLPELYYPNGKMFKITKKDLLDYIN